VHLGKSAVSGLTFYPGRTLRISATCFAHEYFGVDLEIVGNTIHNDLPMLMGAVQEIEKGIR
jgi:uncharacterized protein with HEPN domain